MDESPLGRLISLATANVRQYTRFERGKQQVVRPHTETRADAAPLRSGKMVWANGGWIPEASWKAGQQDWVKEGEAAWKAKGAEHAAQAKAHDAAADAASKAAEAHRDAAAASQRAAGGLGPAGQAELDRASKVAKSIRQPLARSRPAAPAARKVAPRDRLGSLQARVEHAERARRGLEKQAGQHPLFSRPASGSPEDVINDTAERAVRDAAVMGGVSAPQVQGMMKQMAEMQAELASLRGAETRIEDRQKMKARAELALGILGLTAGILLAALTGGATAIIGELMAFKWTSELAVEFAKYFGVELNKAHAREVLASPHTTAKKALSKAPRPHNALPPFTSRAPESRALAAKVTRKTSP